MVYYGLENVVRVGEAHQYSSKLKQYSQLFADGHQELRIGLGLLNS